MRSSWVCETASRRETNVYRLVAYEPREGWPNLTGNLTRLGKEDSERALSLSQHDKRSCVDMKRHFRSTVVTTVMTTSNLSLRAVISLL
jgi:hypothetical protein